MVRRVLSHHPTCLDLREAIRDCYAEAEITSARCVCWKTAPSIRVQSAEVQILGQTATIPQRSSVAWIALHMSLPGHALHHNPWIFPASKVRRGRVWCQNSTVRQLNYRSLCPGSGREPTHIAKISRGSPLASEMATTQNLAGETKLP